MRFSFFSHMRFSCQKNMGFSGSVKGTAKNPGFLDFGFCQCKWAYCYKAGSWVLKDAVSEVL